MTSTAQLDDILADPDVWQYIAAHATRTAQAFAIGTYTHTVLAEVARIAPQVAELLERAAAEGPGLTADTVEGVASRQRLADLDADVVDEQRGRRGRVTIQQIARNRR